MPYHPDKHGPKRLVGPGFHAQVFAAVKKVPKGRVTTYGDVGKMLGSARIARHIGFALAALPADRKDVPWHRVVNSRGLVALRGDGRPSERQRRLLRKEGIEVQPSGKIVDFRLLRWPPATPLDDEAR